MKKGELIPIYDYMAMNLYMTNDSTGNIWYFPRFDSILIKVIIEEAIIDYVQEIPNWKDKDTYTGIEYNDGKLLLLSGSGNNMIRYDLKKDIFSEITLNKSNYYWSKHLVSRNHRAYIFGDISDFIIYDYSTGNPTYHCTSEMLNKCNDTIAKDGIMFSTRGFVNNDLIYQPFYGPDRFLVIDKKDNCSVLEFNKTNTNWKEYAIRYEENVHIIGFDDNYNLHVATYTLDGEVLSSHLINASEILGNEISYAESGSKKIIGYAEYNDGKWFLFSKFYDHVIAIEEESGKIILNHRESNINSIDGNTDPFTTGIYNCGVLYNGKICVINSQNGHLVIIDSSSLVMTNRKLMINKSALVNYKHSGFKRFIKQGEMISENHIRTLNDFVEAL